ncbi:MAG: hypothetical protein K9I29_07160 [Bacteroidales bacterium]|nr:hypothetical protein [Bacteroidales bacterium]
MAKNQGKLTSKDYLKELKTFYRFTIQGLIILTVAVLGMSYLGETEAPDLNFEQGTFILIMLAVFLIVYAGGWLLRRKMHNQLLALPSLKRKLQKYRLYFLMSLLSWKLIGLLAMVGFYISANYVFLLITALALLGIISQKPNLEKIAKEIELSSAQKGKMQDPEFVIS